MTIKMKEVLKISKNKCVIFVQCSILAALGHVTWKQVKKMHHFFMELLL